MTDGTVNVLIVDDSPVAQMHLRRILEDDPQTRVIGMVGDGQAGLDFVRKTRPDVLLMDIHMPGMDGFEATRRVMETVPVPIIICTSTADPRDVAVTFRVLEAGALACIEKPVGREHAEFERMASELRQAVRLMSEIKVVRRWAKPEPNRPASQPAPERKPAANTVRIVGIGTSTGGPLVLQTILSGLPKSFPVPILIVQHIASGFLPGMAEWLSQTTALPVHIAAYGVRPQPGHVYLAPDDFQMGLRSDGSILLTKEEGSNGLRPAVSYLFRSLIERCGPSAIGVLLTGMGKDGAEELKQMRDAGAITIAQDRETSVVHGMPGEAIQLGGAVHVLPAEKIASMLQSLVSNSSERNGTP